MDRRSSWFVAHRRPVLHLVSDTSDLLIEGVIEVGREGGKGGRRGERDSEYDTGCLGRGKSGYAEKGR